MLGDIHVLKGNIKLTSLKNWQAVDSVMNKSYQVIDSSPVM